MMFLALRTDEGRAVDKTAGPLEPVLMQGLLAAPGGGKRAGTSVSAPQVSSRVRLAVFVVVLDGARIGRRRRS